MKDALKMLKEIQELEKKGEKHNFEKLVKKINEITKRSIKEGK